MTVSAWKTQSAGTIFAKIMHQIREINRGTQSVIFN
jgi:hypothetical protein